ncbi:T9SS C-terminal target domain-containing protein [Flavobacterium caseinilyticum]|uniref:T9SS C-terminal target domain-containing protein n=1 Tax=Flavobacterium caseinilyticum TaxID=2541732 RepID=A0A4R5AWZ3_9FLAO|nr:T9SS C-terminal target domain-containing protein [Flavobacterium caseinilyticum]
MFSLALLFAICTSQAQILGCIDPLSKNYNSAATVNDGSCDYASARIKPKYSVKLDAILKETSSLIQSDSLFWTSNDDTDTALYEIDNKGVIQNKIELKNVTNTDWEEIAQDNDYFYIGDFGNNVSGNRKDLHILRVEKQSLSQHNPKIDTLSFSYSNQTDFKKAKANTTNFDCEAFVVSGDSIYMFTKEWKEKRTSVYVIPKLPGNHIAKLKESYNVKGLITAATYLAEKKLLVLAGYSKSLSPFLYLFYDYNESGFFSGNKRKIKIALPFHQMEGISTLDGLHYFLTNENFARKRIINVPQQLHQFDLSAFLANYLKQ